MKAKLTFDSLKVGDRVKTKYSGWATVIKTDCYKNMVKLDCDEKKWCCPYFYERELDLEQIENEHTR